MRNGLVVILVLVIFSASCAAHAADSLPAWPQQFSLCQGESVQYTIPVTAPGDIVVDAAWQGGGLMVTLDDPSGKAVNTPSLQGSPVKLTYTVTGDDLKKGVLWTLRISTSQTPARDPRRPVATGQVTVKSPALNTQAVLSLQDSMRARLSVRPTMTTKPNTIAGADSEKSADAVLLAKLKGQMDVNTRKYNQHLLELAKTLRASGDQGGQTNSSLVTKPLNPLAGRVPDSVKTGLQPAGDPALIDITPANGKPGAIVVIRGKNIPTDKSCSQVWFQVTPTLWALAGTRSITTAQGIISYEVRVPSAPHAVQTCDGQVYVKCLDDGKATNMLAFRYEPAPLPDIVSSDPEIVGPGDTVRLTGLNFKADDELHFVLPGGSDVVARKSFVSSTLVTATVPEYTSNADATAQVYAKGVINYAWVKGSVSYLPLKSTSLTISGLDRTEGKPGQPVLISGNGFRNPIEVHFVYSSGKDEVGSVLSCSYAQVMAEVPSFSGVAAPYPGQIYVKCAGQTSASQSFSFDPAIDWVPLDFNKYDLSSIFHFVKGDDWDSWQDNTLGVAGVYHRGSFWTGHKNEDVWFDNIKLKNGYVVDSIYFGKTSNSSEADAYIVESHEGTDNPYVRVHWWDTPVYDSVYYYIGVNVKGPRGVPYW